MFTDSHCHVYKEYYSDIDTLLKECTELNVNRLITCGCSGKENKEVLEVINKYDSVYGAIGIHPENVDTYTKEDINYIIENISNNKVIAIGEIGLDYHYTKENKDKQIELLETQLKIAEKYNIPVIIHSRDATLDTLNILKKYKCTGIIHSFSGSLETAKEYIKMGYLLGVNGVITFKNSHIHEVIKDIPVTSLVVETDSPYLTPTPLRGQKNSPKNVVLVFEYLSNLFNISNLELSSITNDNLKRIFDKLD